MRGRQTNIWWARAGMAAGFGTLLFTVGCGASQNAGASAALPDAAAQPGTPVVVSCEPNQRTLVRPTVINGVALSQVECVSTGEAARAANQPAPSAAAVPVSYAAGPPRAVAPRSAEWGDTRIVQPEPPAYPVAAARPVPTQQIVYDDDERPVRVVKRGRSVKKSAIIIGSSAGVGAGVGAAVGGKKGALIGAVVGGGGATLWDQITRRKD
jgi:hypothetical protein